MAEGSTFSRRQALTLASAGTAVGALALAGCTSNASSDPSTSTNGTDSRPRPTPSGIPTSSATTDPNATVIATVSEVPVGGTFATKIDGADVLLAQPVAGTFTAFSAVCTHQGCAVKADGAEFVCPCHGSTFNVVTGAAIVGPAFKPLTKINIMIQGNNIVKA